MFGKSDGFDNSNIQNQQQQQYYPHQQTEEFNTSRFSVHPPQDAYQAYGGGQNYVADQSSSAVNETPIGTR